MKKEDLTVKPAVFCLLVCFQISVILTGGDNFKLLPMHVVMNKILLSAVSKYKRCHCIQICVHFSLKKNQIIFSLYVF